MRLLAMVLALFVTFSAGASMAQPAPETLSVTVSYRERIALPPDAQLDVQLLDLSQAGMSTRRIASQRYVMTGTPMTVGLSYDPALVTDDGHYAVVATLWSGDRPLFRSIGRHTVLAGTDPTATEILLTMMDASGEIMPLPRTIAGLQWEVTEIAGAPWSTEDAATLTIDDAGNLSVFGGCNRFRGQVTVTEGEIAFPEALAGTLMACPEPVDALERQFLEALRQVSGYVRYGKGLVMTDAGGHALLHFVERPE